MPAYNPKAGLSERRVVQIPLQVKLFDSNPAGLFTQGGFFL